MRQILFRGKLTQKEAKDRPECPQWVEGFLKVDCDEVFILVNHDGDWYEIQVLPKTVGQLTGVTDKNGAKVFEGDVLEEYSRRFIITWHDKKACFYGHDTKRLDDIPATAFRYCKVIGNIHDNPELLKGSEELKP